MKLSAYIIIFLHESHMMTALRCNPSSLKSCRAAADNDRDFFASIRDVVGGRSGSYEEVLREAKETALREMQDNARAMGANAVIGVDLDYETVGGSGSMLMVTACGTAVTVE